MVLSVSIKTKLPANEDINCIYVLNVPKKKTRIALTRGNPRNVFMLFTATRDEMWGNSMDGGMTRHIVQVSYFWTLFSCGP